MSRRSSRRQFLKQTGFLVAGLGFGGKAASNLLAQAPTDRPAGANERIKIGCIGVGNQGKGNMRKVIRDVVAVCEVDTTRLAEARNLVQKQNGGECAGYAD